MPLKGEINMTNYSDTPMPITFAYDSKDGKEQLQDFCNFLYSNNIETNINSSLYIAGIGLHNIDTICIFEEDREEAIRLSEEYFKNRDSSLFRLATTVINPNPTSAITYYPIGYTPVIFITSNRPELVYKIAAELAKNKSNMKDIPMDVLNYITKIASICETKKVQVDSIYGGLLISVGGSINKHDEYIKKLQNNQSVVKLPQHFNNLYYLDKFGSLVDQYNKKESRKYKCK